MSPSVTVLEVCGFVIILDFSFQIRQKAPRRRLHYFTGIHGAGQLVLTLSDSLHCRCEEFSFTVSFIGHPKMTASYYHNCINNCCELLGPSSITILLQWIGERGPDLWECVVLRVNVKIHSGSRRLHHVLSVKMRNTDCENMLIIDSVYCTYPPSVYRGGY